MSVDLNNRVNGEPYSHHRFKILHFSVAEETTGAAHSVSNFINDIFSIKPIKFMSIGISNGTSNSERDNILPGKSRKKIKTHFE